MRPSIKFALASLVAIAFPLAAQDPRDPVRAAQRGVSEGQILMLLQSLPPEAAQSIGWIINGLISDTTSHMKMAERRPATTADSSRGREVVSTMHSSLHQYSDVSVAEKDGYVLFLPWLKDQPVYHYNNALNSRSAQFQFDATKPTSLLYRKSEKGRMILVGAMYTAPAYSTLAELDKRLPLGMAYWHQHVNFCARRPTAVELQSMRPDSTLVAHSLAIQTAEQCTAEGGMFLPQLFGWMAHVNAFAGDDLKTIWGEEGHDHMNSNAHAKHSP